MTFPGQRPLLRPMPDEWIDHVLSADYDIYPSSLEPETLKSWVRVSSAFTMQYIHPSAPEEVVGVCIMIPALSMWWKDIINGKIHEWEITPGMLWHRGHSKADVGIHIWHIERYPGWERRWGGFGKYIWHDVQEAIRKEHRMNVIGYSALAVTSDGIRLFQNGMGWTGNPDYEGQWVVENVQTRERKIIDKRDWVGMDAWKIVGDCKMLVKMENPRMH